jgi:hypothetical protein
MALPAMLRYVADSGWFVILLFSDCTGPVFAISILWIGDRYGQCPRLASLKFIPHLIQEKLPGLAVNPTNPADQPATWLRKRKYPLKDACSKSK